MVQTLWQTVWQFLRKINIGNSLVVQWLGSGVAKKKKKINIEVSGLPWWCSG